MRHEFSTTTVSAAAVLTASCSTSDLSALSKQVTKRDRSKAATENRDLLTTCVRGTMSDEPGPANGDTVWPATR